MSLQLPAILSPLTPCIPFLVLTVRSARKVAEVASPFAGRLPVLGFAVSTQARQCIRPYRVHHGFVYGLAVRLRLLSTPSLDDAVTFDYGQPVLCPMGTFTPLLVCTLRRTQIKQSLQLCDFLGNSANAVRWQIWTALLLYVLMRFLCLMSSWSHSFTRLFTLLRAALWRKIDLWDLLRFYGIAGGHFRYLATPQSAYLPGFAQ